MFRSFDLFGEIHHTLGELSAWLTGLIGVLIFDEKLEDEVLVGSGIVVFAGLFTFWREHIKKQ